ncbi:MAG TPA: carbamoyltransferase C-terminal domain-containing protein [Nevskiaceae bacterium]|nr:carbamoyltransferase C-terminal domain-containing protein [Nevskiaceae bacterium]
MYILGFSDSVHDRSVCLFKDSVPLVAIEEERLTRVKHGLKLYGESRKNPGIFSQMNLESEGTAANEAALMPLVDYCLDAAKISWDDVDITIGNSLHLAFPFHGKSLYINHHLAHASAAFYASGFEEAAIFAADGYGDLTDEHRYETIVLAHGKGKDVKVLETIEGSVSTYYDMQNSLGVFYRIGSLLSGFGMFDEGKTMGLSSYGEPVYYDQIKKYLTFTDKMVEIDNCKLWDELSVAIVPRDDFKTQADIASSFQKHLEELIVFYVNRLHDLVKTDYLCIAGGTGLNCVSNAKLTLTTKFKEVFVFPATGDNGNSFGAAYYAAHKVLGLPRTKQLEHSYFGKSYTPAQEEKALAKKAKEVAYEKLDTKRVIAKAADLLEKDEIMMWYQEGCELGPRALGHRSIIANPTKKETKDYINAHVKFRESFRPLAPIVLEERAQEFFDFKFKSPFMLFSPGVKLPAKKLAPAVVHINDTARLQTLNKQQNPKLYSVIETFAETSGVPIVLNTSFNGKDEPIVETPEEALNTFLKSPVKHLFLDNFYVTKK